MTSLLVSFKINPTVQQLEAVLVMKKQNSLNKHMPFLRVWTAEWGFTQWVVFIKEDFK